MNYQTKTVPKRRRGYQNESNVIQINWTEGNIITKEIKRTIFTFKRSEYQDLLARISQHNRHLKTLTNQSILLAPERRVEYHGTIFSQLKEASRSIYWAIRNSIACNCSSSHQVSLRLAKPKLIACTEKSQSLRDSDFPCAVSYLLTSQNTLDDDHMWSLMVLRVFEPLPTPPETPEHQNSWALPDVTASPTKKLHQLRKKPGVSELLNGNKYNSGAESLHTIGPYSVQTAINASRTTTTAIAINGYHETRFSTKALQEQRLEDPMDLCKFARKTEHSDDSGCFGLISNRASEQYPKFGVYPQTKNEDSSKSMISLRAVLESGETGFPTISYAEGLKLAVDISSGVLQLINTSWLSESITDRDIMFPLRKGCPVYSQPFIVKTLSESIQDSQTTPEVFHRKVMEKNLFSLGILLSEILLSRTMDHIWDAKIGKPIPNAVIDLLREIETRDSSKFYSAIHRFLFCKFDFTLGDETFCKEVYGKAIALMEEDLQLPQSIWK